MKMQDRFPRSAAVIAALVLSQTLPGGAETVYMIGNSFTHNSMPYSLPALAREKSDTLTVGAHINSGSPLHNILGRPDDGREISPDFGKFRDALTKHRWDAVTLQPFYKRPFEGFPQSTMQTDIDSILSFIELTRRNPANKNTKYYIYESWPFLWTGKPFRNAWDATTVDDPSTATSHTRDYYEHLLKRLRAKSDAEFYIIPIPEVMYELDGKMQAGRVPGLGGIGDLMKDKLHLDPGLGQYIAGVTVYATLFGKNPEGLVKPDGHYDSDSKNLFTPEIYAVIHKTVWEVVSRHPYTGIARKP